MSGDEQSLDGELTRTGSEDAERRRARLRSRSLQRAGASSAAIPPRGRRIVTLAVIAVTVATGVGIDQWRPRVDKSNGDGVGVSFASASASPISAASSSWFCGGGVLGANSAAALTLVVSNPTDAATTGTIRWTTDSKQSLVSPIVVPAGATVDLSVPEELQARTAAPTTTSTIAIRSTVSAAPGDPAVEPEATSVEGVGAVAEFDRGGVVVERTVSGRHGSSTASCASSAFGSWYSAGGATTTDARTLVALNNPFPGDAVVDVRVFTEGGTTDPAALQGIAIPGNGVRTIDIGGFVRRRHTLGVSVTARVGRFVGTRVSSFDGSGESPKGITLSPGTVAPVNNGYFAGGVVASGRTERYEVLNPSGEATTVDVVVLTNEGAVTPLELSIEPNDRAQLDLDSSTELPAGTTFGVIISGRRGRTFVAERTVLSAAPAILRGVASTPAVPVGADRWFLAAGKAAAKAEETVTVMNVSDRTAQVEVAIGLGDLGDTQAISRTVASGRQIDVRIGEYARGDHLPVTVVSDSPVLVLRTLSAVAGRGPRAIVKPGPALFERIASVRTSTTSSAGVTTSSGGVTTSSAGVTTSSAGVTTSGVSTSTAGVSTSTAGVSTSTAGVTTSGVSTSTAGVSTSSAGVSTSSAGVSTSSAGVSTSTAGVTTTIVTVPLAVLGPVTKPGRGWSSSVGVVVPEP